MEIADTRPGCQWLVDEHRHYGRLRQLLSEAGASSPRMGLGPICLRMRSIPSISPTSTGQPLDGANKYTIHFDKGDMPPVDAFWSITLYDPEGFQVANPLNRFAVSQLDAVHV